MIGAEDDFVFLVLGFFVHVSTFISLLAPTSSETFCDGKKQLKTAEK